METVYPPPAFKFRIEFCLDGIQNNNSIFEEVSGLTPVVRKQSLMDRVAGPLIPGANEYSFLVLNRGKLSDQRIFKWITDYSHEAKSPIQIIITLLNVKNEPEIRWKIPNTRLTSFKLVPPSSVSDDSIFESITFSYKEFTIEDVHST